MLYIHDTNLLIPKLGLPTSGCNGYRTWFLAEVSGVTLRYPFWSGFKITFSGILCIALFVASMLTWICLYKFQFPPYDNYIGIYVINTVAEVSGTLVLPSLFTGTSRKREGY